MNKIFLARTFFIFLLLIMTGCRTDLAVNFGNMTASKIHVQSSYTGREVEVAPGQFKSLAHSSGEITVTTEASKKIKFLNVNPFDVDRRYLSISRSIFGPNSVTLNIVLETNMELYVLLPDKNIVDEKIDQPTGYPKVGQEYMSN